MKTLHIILLVQLVFSCNSSHNEPISLQKVKIKNNSAEVISVDKKEEYIGLDQIIDSINFIRLETNKENLIGQISQLLFTNNKIIVVDKDYSKAIFVYDYDGNLITKIQKNGKGSNEYLEIMHVSINPYNEIVILDLMGRKYLTFKTNGNFVKQQKIPFLHTKFEFIGDSMVAYHSGSPINPMIDKQHRDSRLKITDINEKILNSFFKFNWDVNKMTFTTMNALKCMNSQVYYNPSFTDTIYQFTDKGLIAKYYLLITENQLPKITVSTTTAEFQKWLNQSLVFQGDYLDLKNYLIAFVATPNGYPFVIYSKNLKKSYLFNNTGDNIFHTFFGSEMYVLDETNVIKAIPAYKILNINSSLDNVNGIERLEELQNNLSENDNPVLIRYTIKDKLN